MHGSNAWKNEPPPKGLRNRNRHSGKKYIGANIYIKNKSLQSSFFRTLQGFILSFIQHCKPIQSNRNLTPCVTTWPPSVLMLYPTYQRYKDTSFQTVSSGKGASTSISFLDTGWTNCIRRACKQILPLGLLRWAPYFKSPFIGHPKWAN